VVQTWTISNHELLSNLKTSTTSPNHQQFASSAVSGTRGPTQGVLPHALYLYTNYKKDFSKVEILESFFLSSIAVKKHHGKKCRST